MENGSEEFKIKSSHLKGKNVLLGITGSIGAVESVKLVHELRRHMATVNVVMTPAATEIISPDSLEYASGNSVVTKLTGKIEHISLVRNSDILLIAPATANSISKMALGIDDTPVTSLFTNSLGHIPVVVVPVMHENMYSNPIIKGNIERLRHFGVSIMDVKIDEGKAKIPDPESIAALVIRTLGGKFKGKKICIIGGSSFEKIDDVRIITNRSTGETAVELAREAYLMGADLDLYFGSTSVQIPSYLNYRQFTTVESLLDFKKDIARNEIVLVPAALSDFSPNGRRGKLPSDKKMNLELYPTPKFLRELRKIYRGKLVGFKAEYGISRKLLESRAKERLNDYGLDAVIANDLRNVKKGYTKVLIITGQGTEESFGEKNEVARDILNKVC